KASRRKCEFDQMREVPIRQVSADVYDAPLSCFLGWRLRLCRKLKHRCFLTLITGPGPGSACLFSARLWHRRSAMGPLDSQPAATILQTESSHRSTTTDEKCHPRPHHRSAA